MFDKNELSLQKNKKELFFQIMRDEHIQNTISDTHIKIFRYRITYKQTLTKKLNKKYLKIKKLRIKLFGKRSYKKKKQIWFEAHYRKKRRNFLKTILGQYLILAHLSSHAIYGKRWISTEPFFKQLSRQISTTWAITKDIQLRQKLSWYYTNLIRLKKAPYNLSKRTKKIFPYKIFSGFWVEHKKAPWLEYLKSKRRMYSWFIRKTTTRT